MANIKSKEKRNRQNEKRRLKNAQIKSSIRTNAKKIVSIINSKEEIDKENLKELYKHFVKTIDTAAGKGIIHQNTAARKKSNLAKKVNSVVNQQA